MLLPEKWAAASAAGWVAACWAVAPAAGDWGTVAAAVGPFGPAFGVSGLAAAGSLGSAGYFAGS